MGRGTTHTMSCTQTQDDKHLLRASGGAVTHKYYSRSPGTATTHHSKTLGLCMQAHPPNCPPTACPTNTHPPNRPHHTCSSSSLCARSLSSSSMRCLFRRSASDSALAGSSCQPVSVLFSSVVEQGRVEEHQAVEQDTDTPGRVQESVLLCVVSLWPLPPFAPPSMPLPLHSSALPFHCRTLPVHCLKRRPLSHFLLTLISVMNQPFSVSSTLHLPCRPRCLTNSVSVSQRVEFMWMWLRSAMNSLYTTLAATRLAG